MKTGEHNASIIYWRITLPDGDLRNLVANSKPMTSESTFTQFFWHMSVCVFNPAMRIAGVSFSDSCHDETSGKSEQNFTWAGLSCLSLGLVIPRLYRCLPNQNLSLLSNFSTLTWLRHLRRSANKHMPQFSVLSFCKDGGVLRQAASTPRSRIRQTPDAFFV